MIEEGKILFRTFRMEMKKRPLPYSLLLTFSGGTDIDSRGWESAAGDRKKLEEDLKFMWNPYDAPSNKKGEYLVKFASEDKYKRFLLWLDGQIRQYGGVLDK